MTDVAIEAIELRRSGDAESILAEPAGHDLGRIVEDAHIGRGLLAFRRVQMDGYGIALHRIDVQPVAQARGVILEALASRNSIPGEYTPMQVKLQISGYGKAEKVEVQWAVARLLGFSEIIKPDDASDALAIAVCHARMCLDVIAK